MARRRELTDLKIRNLEIKDKEYHEPVDGLPMSVRVARNGVKSYWVKFRIYPPEEMPRGRGSAKPKQVFCSIGRVEEFDLEEAKERARKMISAGKAGIDQRKVWAKEHAEAVRQAAKEHFILNELADPGDPSFLKTAWMNYVNRKTMIKPRTKQNLKRLFNHITYCLGEGILTADLKASDVGTIKAALYDRPAEFNKFRAALYSVLESEFHDERISQNIMKKNLDDVRPHTPKFRNSALSKRGVEQFKAFYEDLENFQPQQRNHARFLLCLLYTGLRPSMLRSLLKEDNGQGNFVDLETGQLTFRQHKTIAKLTEKASALVASPTALEIMRAAADAAPYSPYVFGSLDDRTGYRHLPLSEKGTQVLFRANAHRFEVEGTEKLDIYSLRHTFGTMMVNGGIPIHQLKDQMLHESIVTTQRYVKTTAATRRALANKIDEII